MLHTNTSVGYEAGSAPAGSVPGWGAAGPGGAAVAPVSARGGCGGAVTGSSASTAARKTGLPGYSLCTARDSRASPSTRTPASISRRTSDQ